ncbi:MAG TPA: isocitrate lyase/phosphoenolpyruvate mutase family protein [Gemmatimonadaceae bacterium]|jgi:2-methylisocitrate lyase-like PEP mutase family enzyme
MSTESQAALAERLRAMHHAPLAPLILPNAWDAASARIIEQAGFSAIATTSAGMAWSLGYPDGERMSRATMLAAVARIAARVRVPVTADLEAGYGPRPEDAAATATGAIEAGAVGFNFEDARDHPDYPLFDIGAQVERIHAARDAGSRAGVPLVINARTDVYLAQVGEPGTRFAETVRRLAAYRDAGADCLFAPGLTDAPTIGALVRELGAPVNILVGPHSPTVNELATLGVARISLGGAVMRSALDFTRRAVAELREQTSYATIVRTNLTHADMQKLMG